LFDALFDSHKNTVNEILRKCSNSATGKCTTDDYHKLFSYLNYKISVLASLFTDAEITKLQQQITEITDLLKTQMSNTE
jgi:hypothetical protein